MSQAGALGNTIASGSVTLLAGPGISITGGSPLSLGGTATITNTGFFAPNQTINEFDDFLSIATDTSKLLWQTGTAYTIDGTTTNPGIIEFSGGVSNFIILGIQHPGPVYTDPFVLGGGSILFNWVMDLISLSDNTNPYTVYIGLMDSQSATLSNPPLNGCYFQYTHTVNGGKWQIVCIKGGVSTVSNTNTVTATGFHNYGISINAAATSVKFLINGVEVANSPISTNIPITPITPSINAILSAGTLPNMQIDLFYYTQTLTTAR